MSVQARLTADAYFHLPETNLPTELIDGEVIDMPSPTFTHQQIVIRLIVFFTKVIERIGGQVVAAPFDVLLDSGNVVQPDVMWLAPDSACLVTEQRLIGAPDLVVEVVSPGSAAHDRKTKFQLYQQHGVREYWIIDPLEKLLDVFTRVDDRLYWLNVYSGDETFASPLLGDLALAEIFPA